MPRQPELVSGESGKHPAAAIIRRGQTWLWIGLLFALTLASYGRVFDAEFVSIDDQTHVYANPHLRPPSLAGLEALWSAPYGSMYMPLSYTFFAAETWLAEQPGSTEQFGLNPHLFHIVDALLHATNVVLLFIVLRLVVADGVAACLGAMLFAWHPLQVQSVAWISGTPGLLATFFSLLSIHQYLRFRAAMLPEARHDPCDADVAESRPALSELQADVGTEHASIATSPNWRQWAHYVAACLAYLLALLCKPSAASVPLVLVVFEVIWLRRSVWRSLALFGAWAIPAFMLASLTHELQARHVAAFVYVPPWWLRPLVAFDALAFYLQKLVLPIGLGIDDGRTPEYVFSQPWVYVIWMFPAALIALCAWSAQRRAWLTALALFAAGIAPVLGLVPFVFQDISTVASRYVYLAMLGPAFALAWFMAQPIGRTWRTEVAIALLLFGAWTVVETGYWQNTRALAERGLAVNHRSGVALSALAQLAIDEQNFDEAERLLRLAAEYDPQGAHVWNSLGLFYAHLGRDAEAVRVFERAAEVCPYDPVPHVQMANLRLRQGEYARVISAMDQLLASMPDQLDARQYLATALLLSGRYAEAIRQGEELLRSSPQNADAHILMGTALANLGQFPAAREHLLAALAIRPGDQQILQVLEQIEGR